MINQPLENIERLETRLWSAADNLRANSKLTSSEYCIPVLGIIFLRHATNRYKEALRQITLRSMALALYITNGTNVRSRWQQILGG